MVTNPPRWPRPCATALLIGGWLGAGCSLLHAPPVAPPPAPAVEPPPPPLPRPAATHKFEIDPGTEIVGYVQKTVIGKEDTLPDIARRFDVGYEEMLLANPGVDPWLPGVGREVVVPTQFILPAAPHEGVVVNVAAMRIFYFPPHKKDEPQRVLTHPIGIGKVGWKTPEGTTRIVSRQKDPVWVVPKSVRDEHAESGDILPGKVPPGPDNPLGEYMFRLAWPSYLIHGTNKPYGVGMRSSHGCIRLYPEDIAVFFDLVPVGTKVRWSTSPTCSAGVTARCTCRRTRCSRTTIATRTAKICSIACSVRRCARPSRTTTRKSTGGASPNWRMRRAAFPPR